MFARLRQLFRTSALRLALRYALLNVTVLAVALAVLFVVVTHYVDGQIESALAGELAALASLPAEHRLESVRVLSALRGEERQLRYYRLETVAGQMVAGNIEAWPTTLPVDGVVRVSSRLLKRNTVGFITSLRRPGFGNPWPLSSRRRHVRRPLPC